MFICDDVYCGGLITIMWSLKVFINNFYLSCQRVKISLVKTLDSDLLFISSVFQLFNLMLIATLSYSKQFEII